MEEVKDGRQKQWICGGDDRGIGRIEARFVTMELRGGRGDLVSELQLHLCRIVRVLLEAEDGYWRKVDGIV